MLHGNLVILDLSRNCCVISGSFLHSHAPDVLCVCMCVFWVAAGTYVFILVMHTHTHTHVTLLCLGRSHNVILTHIHSMQARP